MRWLLPTRVVDLSRPFVLGVVNVTPDSFSDGGTRGPEPTTAPVENT